MFEQTKESCTYLFTTMVTEKPKTVMKHVKENIPPEMRTPPVKKS